MLVLCVEFLIASAGVAKCGHRGHLRPLELLWRPLIYTTLPSGMQSVSVMQAFRSEIAHMR